MQHRVSLESDATPSAQQHRSETIPPARETAKDGERRFCKASPQDRDVLPNRALDEFRSPLHRLGHQNVVRDDRAQAVAHYRHLVRRAYTRATSGVHSIPATKKNCLEFRWAVLCPPFFMLFLFSKKNDHSSSGIVDIVYMHTLHRSNRKPVQECERPVISTTLDASLNLSVYESLGSPPGDGHHRRKVNQHKAYFLR